MTSYKESEMHLYQPSNCPGCGKRVEQSWVDVTTRGGFAVDGERSYMPGLWQCNTVGCKFGPPKLEAIF